MGQDARCAARTEVMLNLTLSPNARILYYLIDDKSGESRRMWWHWRKIAVLIGVGKARFFALIAELTAAGCIGIEKEGRRVTYTVSVQKSKPKTAETRSRKVDPTVQESGLNAARIIIESVPEPVPPLPPASGGIDPYSLEGFQEGCTLCPACDGHTEVGRSPKRMKPCHWCQQRGFMWPRPETVSIGAKAS